MNVQLSNRAAATDPTSQGTSSTSNSSTVTNDSFMQLLIAQLQNQSPLDPVDPNQFVGQLVQFNTLNEIISIRQLLQQVAGSAPTTTGSVQH